MLLSINYSPAARELWAAGRIAFDRWKCDPEFPGLVDAARDARPARPLYLHFPLDLGDPDFAARLDADAISRALEATDTPYVNAHLNARRAHFPEVAGAGFAAERAAVLARFRRHLDLLAGRFGAERVIAENVIYRGEDGPYLRASVEPEVIAAVREAGCGLLLDTAHARVTCAHLGADGASVAAYLDGLPCERLRELHVTGASPDETGRLRDSMPLGEDDWAAVRHALKRIGAGDWPAPWLVALEYGGVGPSFAWRSDPAVIAEQLPALAALLSAAAG